MEADNKLTVRNAYAASSPLYELNSDPNEIQTRLRHYVQVVLRRRWVILTVLASSVILTLLSALKETHVYKASATIQVNLEKAKILPYQEVSDPSPYMASEKYIQTQCSVLQSRSLASRVIRQLNLTKNPAFIKPENPTILETSRQKVLGLFSVAAEKESTGSPANEPEATYSPYTEKLLGNLEIVPSVQRSQIIQINYNSDNPALAATISNAVAREFIQLNLENQYQATQQAMTFLSKQITEMKGKVESADEALLKYARAYDLSLPSDKEKTSPQQELTNLKVALSEANAERIRKESQYQVVRKASPDEVLPTVSKTPKMSSLEEKLAELKQREEGLNRRFQKGWPELIQVAAQRTELERQLREERQKVLQTIQRDYAEVVERENMFKQAAEKQQGLVMRMQEHAIQYNILKRDVEINRQLLESMLQRLKEAAVSSSLSASNITILDLADPPKTPFKPNKKLKVMYGLLIGLFLGLGVAVAMDKLDDTIKTPEEVNYFVRVPVLGVIPSRFASGGNGRMLPIKSAADKATALAMYTIAFADTKSLISEAFRAVRTNMLLSNSDNPPRIVLVTSPQLGDGKTSLSHNIAITLAQINRKVALLDCDLRKPRIHKTFELDNSLGMSSYLSGEADLSACIQGTRIPKLHVIPSGPLPPNPAELLTSERMNQGLEQLSKLFDYVIIDSPPLLLVTDGYILSSIVDGVILVVRADKVPKELLQRTKQNLEEVNANVLGVVLNNVDTRAGRYGYGGYYHYDYTYAANSQT
ncbi:MAG: polysaccharide biosynthesis tyrosine autokinase [Acidobacteria bacterium]|nr:polysaccharide biosynthesis tyrosine autokinase [Acidobacteriota bacterium]MBI3655106.1 polysaccharide biosynthesis tyrosine autokinase [Acidobacteriota bacterium]